MAGQKLSLLKFIRRHLEIISTTLLMVHGDISTSLAIFLIDLLGFLLIFSLTFFNNFRVLVVRGLPDLGRSSIDIVSL